MMMRSRVQNMKPKSLATLGPAVRFIGVLFVLAFSSQSCGNPGSEPLKPGSVSASKMVVSATAGLVSLDVQNAPLGAVLTELGQRTQIVFTIPDEMKSDLITLSVQQRSVEEVVQQLLKGRPYSVRHRQEGDRLVIAGVDLSVPQNQVGSQAAVGVQPTRLAQASQSSASSTASTDTKASAIRTDLELLSLEQSLRESPDPATRIAALSSIAGREVDGSVNAIVVKGLSDRAPEVREAALEILRYSTEPVPISSLAAVATQDSNPAFRVGAMSLLIDQLGKEEGPSEADRNVVRATLQQGLADPDPQVREQASMLLDLY